MAPELCILELLLLKSNSNLGVKWLYFVMETRLLEWYVSFPNQFSARFVQTAWGCLLIPAICELPAFDHHVATDCQSMLHWMGCLIQNCAPPQRRNQVLDQQCQAMKWPISLPVLTDSQLNLDPTTSGIQR